MSKERVKEFLRRGKVMALTTWAKENNVKNIDSLIDQAAKELKAEQKQGRTP